MKPLEAIRVLKASNEGGDTEVANTYAAYRRQRKGRTRKSLRGAQLRHSSTPGESTAD